jgi:hypothetical protein
MCGIGKAALSSYSPLSPRPADVSTSRIVTFPLDGRYFLVVAVLDAHKQVSVWCVTFCSLAQCLFGKSPTNSPIKSNISPRCNFPRLLAGGFPCNCFCIRVLRLRISCIFSRIQAALYHESFIDHLHFIINTSPFIVSRNDRHTKQFTYRTPSGSNFYPSTLQHARTGDWAVAISF